MTTPSKVCARPEITFPIAEKNEERTPARILTRFWRMARIPVKTEAMAVKMEVMREEIDSRIDGILSDEFEAV